MERESKFDIDPSFQVPDVSGLLPDGGTTRPGHEQLRSDYYDTADHALREARITLRRRTGSTDSGWQLKVPHPPFRQEIRVEEATEELPPQLSDLLVGVCAGRPLHHIATLTTERTTVELLGPSSTKLAEVDDDTVHATLPGDDGTATATWREVEVELGEGDLDLLTQLGDALERAGARPSTSASKLSRALTNLDADPLAATGSSPTAGTAAEVLAGYLAEQRRVMLAGDLALRRGDDSVIHKTRVATRRMRSALRTFKPMVEQKPATALGDELRWFAGLMGEIRDRQVLGDRLDTLVSELDEALVMGPVQERIHEELGRERAEHWSRLQEEMRGERYLALVIAVADFCRDTPWTPKA